jgi:hypothetical protein
MYSAQIGQMASSWAGTSIRPIPGSIIQRSHIPSLTPGYYRQQTGKDQIVLSFTRPTDKYTLYYGNKAGDFLRLSTH